MTNFSHLKGPELLQLIQLSWRKFEHFTVGSDAHTRPTERRVASGFAQHDGVRYAVAFDVEAAEDVVKDVFLDLVLHDDAVIEGRADAVADSFDVGDVIAHEHRVLWEEQRRRRRWTGRQWCLGIELLKIK